MVESTQGTQSTVQRLQGGEGGRVGWFSEYCAGILEQPMGVKNRVGIVLLHRAARLHRLAEGLLKRLKIPSLDCPCPRQAY
jgi:hypothetical protein